MKNVPPAFLGFLLIMFVVLVLFLTSCTRETRDAYHIELVSGRSATVYCTEASQVAHDGWLEFKCDDRSFNVSAWRKDE